MVLTRILVGLFFTMTFLHYAELLREDCKDLQDWCETVNRRFCATVPTMTIMCPSTCDSCLKECAKCAQNCTTESDGKYQCTCRDGYRLASNGRDCEDIDECAENITLCGDDTGEMVCLNNEGGFQCVVNCNMFSADDFTSYYKRPGECCRMTYGICGQNLQSRLLDFVVEPIKWPWQAFIVLGNKLCGGTLINDLYVVSAAHCFTFIEDVRKQNVSIRLGVYKSSDLQNPNIISRHAVEVVRHGSYTFPYNDIALIKMNKKVTFSNRVSPVCLPNGEVPAAGTRCFASGYGVSAADGISISVLQESDMTIVDLDVCKEAYKDELAINSTVICARSGGGGCQGNSGGPLVCQRCNSCDWFLVGVTSFECDEGGKPGVYTNVEFFEKWIEENAEDVAIKKEVCHPIAWSYWGDWSSCTKPCGGGNQTRIRLCQNGDAGLPGCFGRANETRECSSDLCGDPALDSWSDWSGCSETCGHGDQTRQRICVAPECEEIIEIRKCKVRECATWASWGTWTDCFPSCGDGQRNRTRSCRNGNQGDDGCEGSDLQIENCTRGPCVIWGEWTPWTKCTVTCGEGFQTTNRKCVRGRPKIDCKESGTKTRQCKSDICKVSFEPWSNWTSCSVTCGRGVQTRTRHCPEPDCELDEFGIDTNQTLACNTHACAGEWTNWSPWEACSATCGPSVKRRIRSCHGGTKCPGDNIEQIDCTVKECLGMWAAWSEWGSCSQTCGSGTRTKTRVCEGGTKCPGSNVQNEDCTLGPCPAWTTWSDWGECSASCDGGTRTRSRTCRRGDSELSDCPADGEQTEDCSTQKCPAWSDWGGWSNCTKRCGGGNQTRIRLCQNSDAGLPGCLGTANETRECNSEICVDPPLQSRGESFEHWNNWTACSLTCGGGVQTRSRVCPGSDCVSDEFGMETKQTLPCNTHVCVGEWTMWSPWKACSATCGLGVKRRIRDCHGDGGTECPGDNIEVSDCNVEECLGTWVAWSEWGSCSRTCGLGTRTKTRACEGGTKCPGSNVQNENCTLEPCAMWTPWSDWGGCSTSCGGGTRTRSRNCRRGDSESLDCPDKREQSEDCSTQKCPAWSDWGDWSNCTKSCGGGNQTRIRLCKDGDAGLPGCFGMANETRECNTEICEDAPLDSWGEWPDCSVTCGNGVQTRQWICGSRNCKEKIEMRNCKVRECATWASWGRWTDCFPSCGDGIRNRTRSCRNKNLGEDGCDGSDFQIENCTRGPCASWGKWSPWTKCPVTCGGGFQTTRRKCVGGQPKIDCKGYGIKARRCGRGVCKVSFEPWSNWTDCSLTCGGGVQTRTRLCPGPKCFSDKFGMETKQTLPCNKHVCIGEWTMWSPWEACSASCGPGVKRRIRKCHGGTKCPGDDTEEKDCNVEDCLGTWVAWSEWGTCSQTCGLGTRTRTRVCESGTKCPGTNVQNEDCTLALCATWTPWSDWGDCPVSCDGGTRTRSRNCRRGDSESSDCPGIEAQTEDCSTEKCPVFCSDQCRLQVLWGYCKSRPYWMNNRCERDCCGKLCEDTDNACDLFACYDATRYESCLRFCGYCP